jgi:hypothetical protein
MGRTVHHCALASCRILGGDEEVRPDQLRPIRPREVSNLPRGLLAVGVSLGAGVKDEDTYTERSRTCPVDVIYREHLLVRLVRDVSGIGYRVSMSPETSFHPSLRRSARAGTLRRLLRRSAAADESH